MKMNIGTQRIVLACFDICSCVFTAAVVLLVCAQPAFAYVDPSVMTYTIQALAGVAVALSAILGVAFRRVRKKLVHVLNIDENVNKLVEHDIHVVDTKAGDEAPFVVSADEAVVGVEGLKAEKAAVKKRRRISWPKRLVLALLVSIFLVFTVYVMPAYELVAGGEASLIFGIVDVWKPVAIAACICAVALGLVLSLFRGRVFDVLLAIVFALGVCSYIQALFLNIGIPAANGLGVPWADYTKITVVSTAVWLVIIAAAVALAVKRVSLDRVVTVVLCAALLIVQGAGMGSLWASPTQFHQPADAIVTEEGLFSVSEKSNVVVFVLDTLDTETVEETLDVYPDLLDGLDGFTFYENSAGGMIPTRYGIPFLLSGYTPQKGDDISVWFNERYKRSTYIPDIHNAGYSVGLYSDSMNNGGPPVFTSESVNIHPVGEKALSDENAARILAQCSLYRELPWIAKPLFWYTTDDVNKGMVRQDADMSGKDTPYVIDDAGYYDKLVANGLSADDDADAGAFRFIHLLGSHSPWIMDENAHYVGLDNEGWGNANLWQQTMGSFVIVKEYIDQLKELGLYDKTTIIITADHGVLDYEPVEVHRPTCPAIFMKPAGQGEESGEPIKVSDVPAAHGDVLASVTQAVGVDKVSTYGIPLPEVPMTDRTRYFYLTALDGNTDYDIKLYEIDGNANDFNNWHLTGDEWFINPRDDDTGSE